MARRGMGRAGLVITVAAALMAGCSGKGAPSSEPVADGRVGGVGLLLIPVSGVTLSSVHYIVTRGSTPIVVVSEGDFPTPGSASDFNFSLSLPVGTGYLVNFSAAAVDVRTVVCRGAFGPFDVRPGSTPPSITVALTCQDVGDGSGQPGVEVRSDACPRLIGDFAVASPAVAYIGTNLELTAKAHDLDGKAVSYSWQLAPSAIPIGSLGQPNAASTALTCAILGSTAATVTVSNGGCTKKLSLAVKCTESYCGNGIIEPGETCDTLISPLTCPATCFSQCGNGAVERPAEDCEPSNTASCDATCHFRPIECNDGFLSPGEACDPSATPQFQGGFPPPGFDCGPDCKLRRKPDCGDGVVELGEECDSPTSSLLCSNGCRKVSSDQCVQCELAGTCFDFAQNCLGPQGSFSRAQQTQCYSVMQCIEQSNCDDGTGTLAGTCYCGTLSVAACQAAPFDLSQPGAPNGPCAAAIQAGMNGVTSNGAVLGDLTRPALPAGAAMQRLNCDKTADSSMCSDVCGFTPGGPAFP